MPESPKFPTPKPQGRYVAATVHEGIAYSAGMTPRIDGELTITGTVGLDVTVEQAQSAAALAAHNAVLAIEAGVGGPIIRCLKMTVFVASTTDFTQHTAVADGASAALADLFGDEYLPARSAVGVASLPSGSPVEIELTAAVSRLS
ncbi:RidA family protein [Nocardia sp. NPDC049707]|uniref:RidA family protein n=1 Tax=Nocardia sp. NPDC049707 TaxID=3154735 RepID=UPI00344507EC